MATYTGQRIKDTYESILKLEDNENLTSSTKKVTDGLGNQTPLSVSSTEVKSSSDIEASGFKTPSGTSSEFLMADGSVSLGGNVDLSDYLKNNEDDTTTGTLTASGLTVSKESSGVTSNKLTFQSQAGGSSNISEGNIYTYSGSDYNVGMVFGTQAKDDSGNEFVLPSFRINDSDNDVTFYHGIEVTDGVKIVSGTSSQFLKADGSVDANTYLTSYTDTNTQLTDEQVQDIIGGMVSSNAESNIAVTYDDVNGKLNFASTDTNTQLTTEQVQDVVGGMWIDGVNTAVTYNDTNGTISIVSTDTNTQRTDEEIRDVASAQWIDGSNTTVVKDDASNTIKINSVNTDTNTQRTDAEINTLIGNYTDAKYLRSNADDTTTGTLTSKGLIVSKDLSSNEGKIEFQASPSSSSNVSKASIYAYAGSDYDTGLVFGTQSITDSGNQFVLPSFRINDVDNDVIFYHGIEVADAVKIVGGTSSQFLKADGTLDNSTYLTSYTDTNTQRSDEEIRDVASAQWVNGTNTTVVKDDGANTIKINSVNTDTNTTYTAGNGLELDGTTFQINGGVIPASVNLNNYDESGYYTQNSNANATSGSNYPESKAGVLTVVVADDNTVHKTQTYDIYNSSAFYNRSYYNGTWSSWRNLAQDTNTNTQRTDTEINTLIGNYTDAKYLRSNTSDTMTGDLTVTGETRVQGSGSSSFVGRVGIGTTTPDHMLELEGAAPFIYITDTTETESGIIFRDSQAQGSQAAAIKFSSTDNKLRFYNNDTLAQRMVIDTSGNLGIGTDSPNYKLDVNSLSGVGARISTNGFTNLDLVSNRTSGYLGGLRFKQDIDAAQTGEFLGLHGGGFDWKTGNGSTAPSFKMRLDNSGNLGIGTDSPAATLHIDNPQTASSNIGLLSEAAAGGLGTINMKVNLPNYGEGIRFLRTGLYNGVAMKFFNNTSTVGSVQINTSSTSYNTTSDYRLKENVVPMENSINRLNKLKPCRFNFLIDVENTVDGFIAHEAQEVVPESVTGEKDELNFEGNPEYQSIDHSKLVPLLTSALQEAISKIDQLETRIQNLEELIN